MKPLTREVRVAWVANRADTLIHCTSTDALWAPRYLEMGWPFPTDRNTQTTNAQESPRND